MRGRSFIDTNIFLYAHDHANPKKREIARELIFTQYRNENCSVSTQVLAEFFQNFVVKFKKPFIDAMKELHFMSGCTVVDQTPAVIAAGARLFKQHSLSFRDSLILASAIEASTEILYTEELGERQIIEGVKITNPFV